MTKHTRKSATSKAALLMTQSDYAKRRKVSRQHVSKLAKAGVLIMRNGMVDVNLSDAVLDDQAKLAVDPQNAPAETPGSYAAARYQRELYVGKLRRLEFEQRAGSLIPADTVAATWCKVADTIRTRLAALPSRLTGKLAGLSDAKQVRALLEKEIDGVLASIAEGVRSARNN